MTAPDFAAHAAEAGALRNLSSADRLEVSPLADVLLFGLSDGDPDPAIGVLGGARLDLDVLLGYARSDVREPDIVEQALRALGQRLDVALELLRRPRRGGAS